MFVLGRKSDIKKGKKAKSGVVWSCGRAARMIAYKYSYISQIKKYKRAGAPNGTLDTEQYGTNQKISAIHSCRRTLFIICKAKFENSHYRRFFQIHMSVLMYVHP